MDDITPAISGQELKTGEGLIQKADPLLLQVDDLKLTQIIDKRLTASKDFFREKYNLFERRKKNEKYLFGRQLDLEEGSIKPKVYEQPYLDNALYEIEASIKPLVMNRLPDLIVLPGQENNPDEEKTAEDLTTVIDTQLKNRQNRTAAAIAFKHHPVYFTGVVKAVWVSEENDYKFIPIHPDYIEVDHTSPSNNADEIGIISETVPVTLQQLLSRFPSKADDIRDEVAKDGIELDEDGEFKYQDLGSTIKYREIWFDWWEEDKEKTEEGYNKPLKKISAFMCKYHDVVLYKSKNPNYDWEGEEKLFTYQDPQDENTKQEVKPEDAMMAMMQGLPTDNIQSEMTFKNYFAYPRKPYFFIGYDQWRRIPYDETTRLEQNIRNQEALDKAGKRIVEKLSKRTKHVWSKQGGVTAAIVEKIDMEDPRQDMIVEGKVNEVHATVPPEQVTPAEFKFLDDTRGRMYSTAGASAVRGEIQSDVATTNQIAREADYTRADDLAEETINSLYEWMGDWSLQFIKLRYSDYHFVKVLGAGGKLSFTKLRGDMVSDGMEVKIKASGTDKVKAKNQANDMAKLQMTDPLNYFKDIGVSEPEKRVQDLMLFMTNPQMYLTKAMGAGDNAAQVGETLNGTPPPSATPDMLGTPPQLSNQGVAPSPTNTGNLNPEVPAIQGSPSGL